MIINAVADQENFEATDADVDQEIEGMAKQYGLEADKAKRNDRRTEHQDDRRRYQT